MTQDLTGYARVRKEFGEHAVRWAEVPVEHSISLPMPTTRWTEPGYAGFASPALRAPRQPLRLRAPDRWWVLGARHGELLAYGRTSVTGLGGTAEPGPAAAEPPTVVVPPATRPVAALLEDLRVLDEAMDQAAGPFFRGEAYDAALRSDLLEIIRAQVRTPAVLAWYEALTPDFFTWLGQ
jgi:hypothetical protein